jgi:hypothetical protein
MLQAMFIVIVCWNCLRVRKLLFDSLPVRVGAYCFLLFSAACITSTPVVQFLDDRRHDILIVVLPYKIASKVAPEPKNTL